MPRSTMNAASRTSRLSTALGCLLALSCGVRAGESSALGPPEWDARHVKTEVPERLVADQVFEATVTFRNAGTRAWGDGMKLRSLDPLDGETWGASFIYLGQGRSVPPGGEAVFTSCLRAPSAPGAHSFRWRVARNEDGAFLGEASPDRTIAVEPRRPAPESPRAPAARAPSSKRVLRAEDLEYLGSFKVPEQVDGCGAAYAESGLALRVARDGTRTLFLRTGLGRTLVYEAAIPEPARLEGTDHSRLRVAEVRKVWGELRLPGGGDEPIVSNGGYSWDEGSRTLWWTYYHGYATKRYPVLGASRLVEGKVEHLGPWWIPEPDPCFKAYWGGAIRLPRDFAERYTGGRTLALGFGGYYSICAAASRGPALAAVADPDPSTTTLDLVPLVSYPWSGETAAPRDGEYFVANCSWGGRPPASRSEGSWTMDDLARAGAFVDLPEVHGLLVLAHLGTGRIGYDYGSIESAGHASWWYFYDPADLGEAARGAREPWEVIPSSRSRVTYPRGIPEGTDWGAGPGDTTGCCFDADARTLYIYQRFAIDVGTRELFPLVHAYRVRRA